MSSDTPELTPAFVLLLTEAQPRLFGFLLKRLGDLDQTHEVLQEVNVVLCNKAGDFEEGTDFMAWAFSVARFQLLAFRKRAIRDRLVFPDDLVSKIDELDSSVFNSSTEQKLRSALGGCIQKLPSEHRDLVIRRYAESVSVAALGADLGKSANAISITLHRIRQQLLQCIERQLSADAG
ncbi:MAG: sigma-70 family RNA polymerase sigma factor [Planctomycetota bacterium]